MGTESPDLQLEPRAIEILSQVTTATITTVLLKKGLRNVWMRGSRPMRPGQPRLVGRAFTLRFVPAREDLATPESWSSPVSINVEYNGMALPIDGFARIPTGQGGAMTYTPLAGGMLPPNQVAILFLANKPPVFPLPGYEACPSGISPALVTADAAVHGTGLGHAFHITTSAPVVAYDIFPYGGGNSAVTSATLLLPTSAWDTSYVAVDAWEKAHRPMNGSDDGGNESPPFLELVAQQDATHVSINRV